MALTSEYMEDFAEMARIELVIIDADTNLHGFKQELLLNEVVYPVIYTKNWALFNSMLSTQLECRFTDA